MNRAEALEPDGAYRSDGVSVPGALAQSLAALRDRSSPIALHPNEDAAQRYDRLVLYCEAKIVEILSGTKDSVTLADLKRETEGTTNAVRDALGHLIAKRRVERITAGHRAFYRIAEKLR